MSGHSHFSTIKHKKEASDAKRSKMFSKLSRQITIAAGEKGGDPETNPSLRLAVEQAKKLNMPKENVERAIKKGTGELEGEILEHFSFEAYGPGGTALIIEGITDNKKRTLSEIKQILASKKGKLVSEGSVRWMFEKKGCLVLREESQKEELKAKEKLEMAAIESGADDIEWEEESFFVYTKPEELDKTKKLLEEKGAEIESAYLDWVPKERIKIDSEAEKEYQNLFESLDENDSVQDVFSNFETEN
jgi:YebC/PmpR family DNA-binding regulatory protein